MAKRKKKIEYDTPAYTEIDQYGNPVTEGYRDYLELGGRPEAWKNHQMRDFFEARAKQPKS